MCSLTSSIPYIINMKVAKTDHLLANVGLLYKILLSIDIDIIHVYYNVYLYIDVDTCV